MTRHDSPTFEPYLPIADYAVVGNQYTTGVIARDGSVVWCCFPELKHASVFAALLDHRRGGVFRLHPAGGSRQTTWRYVERTAVLETSHEVAGGRVAVTDFMPRRGPMAGCDGLAAPPELHRLIGAEGGAADLVVAWAPRFDYARARTTIERADGGWLARGAGASLWLGGLAEAMLEDGADGPMVRGVLRVAPGREAVLVTRFGGMAGPAEVASSRVVLDETIAAWREWMSLGDREGWHGWAGAYQPLIERSAIVLKMLTHPSTGGIAAAPTTSLPERIGGIRNWDYRYAWIRDASFTVQALLALGHSQEARDFVEFAEHAAMDQSRAHDVKLMYDLHGGPAPEEEELSHLEGYRQSPPVRIGNGAGIQTQHDVYGELIDSAYELLRRGGSLEPETFGFLARLADQACEVWREPDDGIWEFRGGPRHFTYSKVMVWVALDRAVRLAEGFGLQGDVDRWRASRDDVRRDILAHGYDEDVGAFVIAYGSKDLDAANLRIPLLEFLPCSDPRVRGTIDRTIEQLTKHGLVYRYLVDDGLEGHEGAFGLCTFWLSEALALSGRLREAREILEGMVARVNDVGLYSEEIDPATGEFLGNFPQAFTHIGLINAALYLAAAEGNQDVPDLEGLPSMCRADGGMQAAGTHDADRTDAGHGAGSTAGR